jgi:pyruvate decarboxylase
LFKIELLAKQTRNLTIFLTHDQVHCEEELIEAIETATGEKKDCFCFIEVIVHKDDTSKELLEWGSRVSAANSRPPNPQ